MIHPLFFSPSIEGGGVEKNLFLISNYLTQKSNKVYLLTANRNMKNNFNKKIIFVSPKTNYWNNKSRFLKGVICFFLFLRLKKNFLIISFQSNILAIFIAKIFQQKIIIRSNTAPEKYINNFVTSIFFKFFFSMANEIIVNSKLFRSSLKKILGLNSVVIYNPIKSKKFFKKYSKKKKLKILTVGRLTDQKNHLLLLNSVKNLKNNIKWDLKIIGRGYKKSKIIDFIKENNLSKKVKILNYKKDITKELLRSDLFILSSNYEGLPNVLIEAQQVGTPIISTNCKTGPSEILLNGKLGTLVPIKNEKILIEKIKEFYFDRRKFIKKAKLAKKYLYRFEYEKNCKKYREIIKKNIYS